MIITDIKQQLKKQNRYSIFIDGVFRFSLNDIELYNQKLKKGMELNDIEVSRLTKLSGLSKLYDRSLGYLAIRERSERELRNYLIRKEASQEDTDIIIDRLRAKNYINDDRFAKLWAENRRKLKNSSKRIIEQELRLKGVSSEAIKRVLNEEAEGIEAESLKALIIKKSRASRYQDKKKLMMYLVGKGYSYEMVKKELNNSHQV